MVRKDLLAMGEESDMGKLSTAGLAAAAGIPPDVVLMALDAGLLTGHVRLVAGRPVYDRAAVDVLKRASKIADRHAAGELAFAEAWAQAKPPASSK